MDRTASSTRPILIHELKKGALLGCIPGGAFYFTLTTWDPDMRTNS